MATTVHEPPKIAERRSPELGRSGNGGFRNLGPKDGDLRSVQDYAPAPSKTGIWVILAAIAMTFAAFTSALVVRQGAAMDWHHLTLPRILYFNTLALLASSVTLEIARRRVAVFMGGFINLEVRSLDESPTRWLYVTLFLGLIFVAGQYAAWLQLRSEGLYLATNPNSSFFYLLTAIHGLHVLGGLSGLTYVIHKLNRVVLRRSTLDSFSYYWHFMGILWVYLLLLLWMRL
jgi:cytochrome c oxidase subunit III